MDSLRIRPAEPAHIELLAGFACAMAWETERLRLDPHTVRCGIGAVFTQPARGRYLLAERGDQVAGALMLTTEWSDWRCAQWWWIQSVYVDPAHRRLGVFRALYRHVADAAAATPEVCGLRLYVEHDNAAAQAAYEGLGMVRSHYRLYEFALPG